MAEIPLFPLGSVLVPGGRMGLQIFEPRYLDLVSRSLKQDSGFGMVWLREGSEVHQPDTAIDPRFTQIGTYAKIVDWDSLPNGLLGLTIEGGRKFRLISSYQQTDLLHMAEIAWLDDEPIIPLPEHSEEMQALLVQLLQHPHIARMKMDSRVTDISTLGFLLAQFLPFTEEIKFTLLCDSDPLQRMADIMDLLEQMSG